MSTTYDQAPPNGTRDIGQLAADPGRLDHLDPAALDARGARIPWGEQPHQASSPVIAAGMLRLLRERDAQLWAELHFEAATGERLDLPRRQRQRKPGD